MNSMATLLKAENEEEMEKQIAEKRSGSDSIVLEYRVTSMYSATMPPKVEKLAKTFLRHPAIVSIGDKESKSEHENHTGCDFHDGIAEEEEDFGDLEKESRSVYL